MRVVLCAVLLLSACRLETRATAPADFQAAPDFSLKAHTGQTVSLAKLRARGPVMVVFYRGYW